MAERTLGGYTQGRPEVTSTYANRRPRGMPERSEFSKGMERGLRSLQGGLYGAAQQAGDVTGIDAVSEYGERGYDRTQQALQDPALQLAQPDVTEIDWKDPNQIVDWASGVVGQTIPYGAAMLVGGGIGAGLARQAPRVGAATGGVAATAPIESGNTYREILDESGVEAPGIAAGAGLISAGLNVAAPATALSRNATGGVASRIARKGAETAAVEAGTETLQEGTSLGARSLADEAFDPFSEEELPETQNRLINAAAGGAVGGGTLGGATGLLPARRQRDPDETFESRYERYLGPVDGPAMSLTPEDADSPLNQAMSPFVEAYRQGDITRDTMLQNMNRVSDSYELDPIIMADIGRRIDDVEASMVKDRKTGRLRLPRDDDEVGTQPLGTGVNDLDSSVDSADNDVTFEDFDQAEAEASSLTMSEFQPDGRVFATAKGDPWRQARQDEGSVIREMERLEAANPGTRFDQVSWYDVSRDALAREVDNEVELNDRLDSMAIELAARNREPLPEGVRPAEYLRTQAALQAVGKVPSAAAPLESQISDAELNQGYVPPQELQRRGQMNRRIKALESQKGLSNDQRVELNNLKRESRNITRRLNDGGILTSRPNTYNKTRDQVEFSQYLPVEVDGKERAIDMTRLTRRMMGSSDISIPENTPMTQRLQTYVSEGLGELAAKGVPIPQNIPPSTTVFNGADGRKYTYGEVFPEGTREVAKGNIDVGRARARVEGAAAELRKLNTVKRNIMADRGLSESAFRSSKGRGAIRWRTDFNKAERQYNDAVSQLRNAERSAPPRPDIQRRPQEGDTPTRRAQLDRGRQFREERRDEDMVRDITRGEGEVANEGESIDNPATAAESDTVARRSAVEGGRSVPTAETDPAPIRRNRAPGDAQFLSSALEQVRSQQQRVQRLLRAATEPGAEVPFEELYSLQLEAGKLAKREEMLKDYRDSYFNPEADERLEYAAGVEAAGDRSWIPRYGSTIPPSTPLKDEGGQMRLPLYMDRNVAKSEAIGSARSDTMAEVERSDTPIKRDRLFRSMENTLQRVGLQDTQVKILSVREAITAFENEGMMDAAAKIQNGSLHGATFGIGKNLQVFIHPKLKGRVRQEIIAHEFGHVLYRTMIDSASPTMRLALTNDFKRWASKYGDGTVDRLLRSKKLGNAAMLYSMQGMGGRSVKELGENAQAYLLNFEEWMADRISREVMANSRPKGPVRQFFSDLVDKIKQVASNLGLLDSSVSDFMRPLVTRPDMFSTLFDDLINPINFVVGPFELTRQNAATMLAAARSMLKDTYSRTSEQAAEFVISQMPQETRDAVNNAVSRAAGVRNQVSKYGDITAGKAYQLWRRGKLKAGPKLEDAFKRITQGLDDLNTANLDTDAAREVDSLLDVPNRAAFSEIQQELQGNYQAIEPQRSFVDKTINGVKQTFFIADERLRATEIPALVDIANMLHKKVGQGVPENTMQTDKQIVRGRWDARVRQIFEDKSADFGDEVLRVMYRPELKDSADPEVQQAANRLSGLMRQVRDYLTESGVEIGDRGPNYFPWVVDLDKMNSENVTQLEQMLERPVYQQALEKELERVNAQRRKLDISEVGMQKFKQEIVKNMSANDGYVDSAPLEHGVDQNPVSPTPYMRSMNRRVLGFLEEIGAPEDREFMASLMQEDMGMVLSNYFSQAAKRGEYAKRFGGDKFDDLMAKARRQGATDEDIDLATDYINATMGLHGRDTAMWLHSRTGLPMPEAGQPINQDVLRGMGSVMVYQNFRTLAGATFTSLADFMGIAVRTGNIADAFVAMKDGFQSMILNRGNDDLSVIAETLGIIDYGVVNEALGWEYGGAYLTGTARKLNEGFFKWIGLQSWTRMSRVMGTSAAMRFLGKHATNPNRHSTRYLQDLGLSAADIITDERGTARVLTYAERQNASEAEAARDDRVRNAIVNFVDESILRPNPSMRPLWASDPHYMLVFHLKSFMFAFHDRILKRVYNEATAHGNFGPLAGLMGYIPVMIAADLVRDLAMNGGEEDPQKANWGMMDYAVDGAFRAGLPGVPGLIGYDIMRDYRYSGIPGVSLLGPTAEQLINPPEFNDWLPGQQLIPDVEF